MKHLRPTHKIGDQYAALIGDNVFILASGTVIGNTPLDFVANEPVEISEQEASQHLVSVPFSVYQSAGERSAAMSDFDQLKQKFPGGRQIFDDEMIDAEIPEMVEVPATVMIGDVPAFDAGEGYYALKTGTLYRDIDGSISANPMDGEQVLIEIPYDLYNEALIAAKSSKSMKSVGETSVAD